MKASATAISICLTLSLWCGGCSREEPPPVQKIKEVKPIKMPVPEKAKTPLTNEEEKANTVVKEAEEVKTAALEQKALTIPETDAREKETAVEEVTGYYTVKKGDSLSAIAAREDVYGDSLKWPILYRLNMDELGKLKLGEILPDRELPEGVRLKTISPDEVRENLRTRVHNVWAVNVLSATTDGKIIPLAIKLINNGYPAYVTRAKVKGKDWMRLRVGFFRNQTEADTEGKKIMAMLKLADSWVVKVGEEERVEFGDY
ncbi:MAG: SPOR domain-containing protein [Desulfobacterales bacterium]|nr:SPOR domain-containing protein [Desulfobacterales bacterium]